MKQSYSGKKSFFSIIYINQYLTDDTLSESAPPSLFQ